MLKKLKSKLKSKSGLTLTEMLITVILLAFFSSACLLGISTALSTRTSMIKAADSDILCSTITQYISNELRLCLSPEVVTDTNTGVKKFHYSGGSTYANLPTGGSKIWIEDGVLKRSIGDFEGYPVFNESAYSGFTLAELEFTIADGKITCSFVIKDGDNPIKTKEDTEFTVTPITPITTGP